MMIMHMITIWRMGLEQPTTFGL